ncbi:MAG: hypothetical protein KAR20_29450, partial [Candidatus Heimdallarchaeota archaeon]|nr:hypothetical protein [Candidatus Heimdallarchaeota archaeon]
MNRNLVLLTGIFLMVVVSAKASEPLDDYSFIRGVCYPGEWQGEREIIERDLGYALRLNLNSTRIWLNYQRYLKDPAAYIKQLQDYIRLAHSMGITTMPILWNGNMIDPAILGKEFQATGEEYVKSIVNALKDEEGLLMWDIMNEPTCNDYYLEAPPEEKVKRKGEIRDFVRRYCTLVKEIDQEN